MDKLALVGLRDGFTDGGSEASFFLDQTQRRIFHQVLVSIPARVAMRERWASCSGVKCPCITQMLTSCYSFNNWCVSSKTAWRATEERGHARCIFGGRHCSGGPGVSPLFLLLLQQLTSNHEPLNLAGAFANRAELHVTVKFLHWVIFDEAVATVDLQRLVGSFDCHFGSE